MYGGHLTLWDREVLAQRQTRGEHPSDIAQELGCHVRAIYRELGRNASAGQYYPARAQALAEQRRRAGKQPWKLQDPGLRQYVEDRLAQYWSPEQISGRPEIDFADRPTMRISPQAPV